MHTTHCGDLPSCALSFCAPCTQCGGAFWIMALSEPSMMTFARLLYDAASFVEALVYLLLFGHAPAHRVAQASACATLTLQTTEPSFAGRPEGQHDFAFFRWCCFNPHDHRMLFFMAAVLHMSKPIIDHVECFSAVRSIQTYKSKPWTLWRTRQGDVFLEMRPLTMSRRHLRWRTLWLLLSETP